MQLATHCSFIEQIESQVVAAAASAIGGGDALDSTVTKYNRVDIHADASLIDLDCGISQLQVSYVNTTREFLLLSALRTTDRMEGAPK